MSWRCLYCETINLEASDSCEVCETERLYTFSDVQNLLTEKQSEIRDLKTQLSKHREIIWWAKQLDSLDVELKSYIKRRILSKTIGRALEGAVPQKT